jgi:hypothetical protein
MVLGDAGGMKPIQSEHDRRWDAELQRRGAGDVAAALASEGVGIGRGAEFRLFVPDLPNPSRGYVEDWLGRKEARAARGRPGGSISSSGPRCSAPGRASSLSGRWCVIG